MSIEHAFDREKVYLPTPSFRGMLGLARRAGRALPGTAATCEAVRKNKNTALVLIDSSASSNTKSKLWGLCHAHGIPYLTLQADGLLGEMLGGGREIVAAAITDGGMARRLRATCTELPDALPEEGNAAPQ